VIERQARARTDAGLPPDGLPDLSAEAEHRFTEIHLRPDRHDRRLII
jgi:hypothetical protein